MSGTNSALSNPPAGLDRRPFAIIRSELPRFFGGALARGE
jgi:hypothetical protein